MTAVIELGDKDFTSTIINMFSVLKDLKRFKLNKERSRQYLKRTKYLE